MLGTCKRAAGEERLVNRIRIDKLLAPNLRDSNSVNAEAPAENERITNQGDIQCGDGSWIHHTIQHKTTDALGDDSAPEKEDSTPLNERLIPRERSP